MSQTIYLASRSPRRRELLQQMGVRFQMLLFRSGDRVDHEVDETPLPNEKPDEYVVRVALAKALHGVDLLSGRHLPVAPVLSADTTLDFDGDIIGKPDNDAHARIILRRLSGHTHRVLTTVAISYLDRTEYVLNASEVTFTELSERDIDAYIATGEHRDKAGAYGIQGHAGMFVERINGSYTGIMGLPLCDTARLLRKFV